MKLRCRRHKRTVARKLHVLALTLLLLLCAGQVSAQPYKNETVYVLLEHDGQVRETTVVNWLSRADQVEGHMLDYGHYLQVVNSVSSAVPLVVEDTVVWPLEAFGAGGLFYQGVPDKQLPFAVAINYMLDGEPVSAAEIAGQSGEVRLEVQLHNHLRQERQLMWHDYGGSLQKSLETLYTPLMFQVTLSLPVNVWSDIEAPGLSQVLVGDKLRLTWLSFPYPEDSLVITMSGSDIELEPLEITVLPMAPPITLNDAEEELLRFLAGLTELEQALDSLHRAAMLLGGGQEQLAAAWGKMLAGLGQIAEGLESSLVGAQELASGALQLQQAHTQLAENSAWMVYSNDRRLQAIGAGIGATQEALQQLHSSAERLAHGTEASREGIELVLSYGPEFSASLAELQAGQMGLAGALSDLGSQGVGQVKAQLVAQLHQLRQAKAMQQEAMRLADEYRSFMDRRNVNSRVQFLLRTPGIKAEPSVPVSTYEPVVRVSWWRRLLARFTRK